MNLKTLATVSAVSVVLLLVAGFAYLHVFTIAGVAGTYRQAVPGMGYRLIKIGLTGEVRFEAHIPVNAPPLIQYGYAKREGKTVAISFGPDLKKLPADRRFWLTREIGPDGSLLPYRQGEAPYVPDGWMHW